MPPKEGAFNSLPADDSNERLPSDTCLVRAQEDSGDYVSASAREAREQGPVGVMAQWARPR